MRSPTRFLLELSSVTVTMRISVPCRRAGADGISAPPTVSGTGCAGAADAANSINAAHAPQANFLFMKTPLLQSPDSTRAAGATLA